MGPVSETHIERDVAFHLWFMKQLLTSGDVEENDVENADETHFIINVDNGRTLGFYGEYEVKCADVVSGSEVITMIVPLRVGWDSKFQPPLMGFMNMSRRYPVRNVPDNILGLSYNSWTKGWIDTVVMPEMFR